MSKKDYCAFAAVFAVQRTQARSEAEQLIIDRVANAIASVLASDNGRFSRQQFLEACGVGEQFNPNRRQLGQSS